MVRKKKTPTKPPRAASSAATQKKQPPKELNGSTSKQGSPDLNSPNPSTVQENQGKVPMKVANGCEADPQPDECQSSPGKQGEVNLTAEAPSGSSPSLASETVNVASTIAAETEKRTLPNVNDPGLVGAAMHSEQEGGHSKRLDSQVPTSAKQVVKTWAECVTGKSHSLQMKGDQYRIESGELCVTIPNAVISKNKKVWANFVLGQFNGNLPSMGALHAILNGIWSNKIRDIAISRVGDQSVLIKIPNANTRKRVLEQGVWLVEGQSMFVAAWEPGLKMEVPELKEVPVWVDFKGVPPHFFSEEGFEYIASLVGQPLQLHPRTAGMLNIEVARVLTLVDLTQTLPEAVYVAFESGERQRIEVSCPWLPPKCNHCHQFGHSLRRCPKAPILCNNCRSTTHEATDCFRVKTKPSTLVRKEKKIWKAVSEEAKATRVNHEEGKDQHQPEKESSGSQSVEHPALADPVDSQNINTALPSERVDQQGGSKNVSSPPVSRINKGITINEPVQTEAPIKKRVMVEGKGKSKLSYADKSPSGSESSSDSEEEGRKENAMNMAKSKSYGRKQAKGRGPSAQPSS